MSRRARILAALLATALLACGCEEIDVSGLVAPDAPTSVPTVTASSRYLQPPEDENRLGNLILDAYTAQGAAVRISDHTVAGMLLQAMNDPGRQFESQAGYPMDNILVIRDADNQEIARMTVSSDGDMVGRNENTMRYFNIPEWVYYQIEYYLWMKNASFYGAPLTWDPGKGDGALMLRIDSMLRVLLPQAYGYAEAYLTSFKLYGIGEGSYQTKVYLLVAYAGYARDGDAFKQLFKRVVPVTLTLYELSGQTWRYIAYQEPKTTAAAPSAITQSAVRAIFPYEHTVQAMDDLKDTQSLAGELTHKAQEWLRNHGLSGLTVSE